MTRALQRMIHVGCRELGLDEETRRDLQLVATGKTSMRDMTEAELEAVVAALKDRGFTPSGGHSARARPAAGRADVRLCHVLWRLLAEAGAVRQPGRAGLNAFIRARFEAAWGSVPIDIDQMHEFKQIDAVIRALKGMCQRAGVKVRK